MLYKEAQMILKKHKKKLMTFGAKAISLFGSVVRDEMAANSDIDILVEFDSKKGFFGFIDLKSFLGTLLNCKVDLVTKSTLHPAFKKKILEEAKHVF